MIGISKKLPSNASWHLKYKSFRHDMPRTNLNLTHGSVILDVVKAGLSFKLIIAVPNNPVSLDLVNTVLFVSSEGNSVHLSTETFDVNYLGTATFTSRHIRASLFIETKRGIVKDLDKEISKVTEESTIDCKTTGLHSWDFNRKCMICGTKEEELHEA